MGIDSVVNTLNHATYTMGAVQGAAETMGSAVYAVDSAVQQVAGVFTGDTYQPAPYYPVAPVSTLGGPKAGLVGALLTGGIVGAVNGQNTANALRTFRSEGFGAGLKSLGKASLKSGLIGAGVMGAVSGIKNFAAASRGEITHAQAGGNVAADTVGGILAGTGGGLTAGAVSLLLPGSGLLSTIGSAVAGAVGATGLNFLYDGSGLRDKVASGISGALGGNNTQYTQGYNYGYPQNTYNYGY